MLYDQIAEIVAEHLDCEVSTIKKDSKFEDLGIDSLDAVELVMKLEEGLGIHRNLNTIEDLVNFVEEKAAK